MRNKKLGIILIISIIIITIIGMYEKPWILAYYADMKHNSYKKGDQMYFSEVHISDLSKYKIHLFRYIKDDLSNDVLMFPTNSFINKNILTLYKRKPIGKYVKTKFLSPSRDNIVLRFYAININNPISLLDTTYHARVPSGYSFIDSNLYVIADYFDSK